MTSIHRLLVCRFAGSMTLALSAIIGCSDGRREPVPVSGVVRIDGEPVTRGTVTLLPNKGRSATGRINDQGRFSLTTYQRDDGALPGTYKVEVKAREGLSERQARWHAPKKYANFETSGIEVEVDEETDSLEIDLSWDGGKPFVETYR